MRELTGQAASIAAGLPGTGSAARPRRRVHPGDGGAAPGLGGELRRRSGGGGRGGAADRADGPADDRAARPVLDRHGPRVRELGAARDDCVHALLAAEREAPEETHARPAIRDLISGLLVSGRTGPELRGLAARCGIT